MTRVSTMAARAIGHYSVGGRRSAVGGCGPIGVSTQHGHMSTISSQSSMDLSNPSSLFLRPGMAEVLRVLAGTTSPLTGRTVARLAGTSHAGAA